MSSKEFVDAVIAQRKVTVFSKSYCPFCAKAKKVLAKYPIQDIEIIEIEDRPDVDEIQDYLKDLTGARSVPRIFIDGKCIGGADDVVALDESGQLSKLLPATVEAVSPQP